MRSVLTCLTVLFALSSGLVPARAADDLTDQQVREAIRQGVQALYNMQEPWGHWDSQNDPRKGGGKVSNDDKNWGGHTALACYGLLTAGEEWQQNPKLQKPLEFLAKAEIDGTYAVGLRAHVWPKLPDKFLPELQEDAYLLVEGLNSKGAYRYVLGDEQVDNSCTQYGVLGSWECAKRGVPIPRSHWERIEKYVLGNDNQNADGGWAYQPNKGAKSNLTMTSAGLAMLYITLDYLHSDEFVRPGVTPRHPVYQKINDGLAAFEKLFQVSTTGYTAVGIERVGLASGRKFFDGKDWYREIAAGYVKKMDNNGVSGGRGADVETAFALVFLSRGRVPVFANKLEIPGFDWDNRPRDLANVTAWAANEFEIPMNWQIVGIDNPAESWLDAPILYLASHQPLQLTDDQLARIKRYIDLGALLVVNVDGGERRFAESVRETFERLYPYKFAQVSADDDIYDIVYQINDQNVQSLNNGVRHLVVMLGKDAGAAWQTQSTRDPSPWYLMANLFQYAIEKSQPRARLEVHHEEKQRNAGRTVHVGRARYDGNWNPEPLAWERVDTFASNQGKTGIETHEVDLANLAGQDVSLVHVAGTDAVKFTPDEVEAIRRFVNDDGGVILFESVGGKPAFNTSVLAMVREAFPGADMLPRRLSATDALISGAAGGYDLGKVGYRLFYKQRMGADTRPMLQAIFIDGKPRVLISAEDLSVGALGQPVWGVFGYDSDSALKMLTNIALFAAREHAASGNVDAADAG